MLKEILWDIPFYFAYLLVIIIKRNSKGNLLGEPPLIYYDSLNRILMNSSANPLGEPPLIYSSASQ